MNCKQCGAQIRREDKRPDGVYQCSGCGKLYRAKAKPESEQRPIPAKRRKVKKPNKWVIIAAALVALAALFLIPAPKEEDEAIEAVGTEIPHPPEPTPVFVPTAVPIQAASVHFRAVGDIMSHKLQLRLAEQDDGSFNYDAQFMYVKEALSKADYTIGNLELSIATDDEYSSFPFFRTPEAILDSLKACGVDLFTMANNHILDGFWDGLVHTIDEVEARGFAHVGAYRSAEEAQQPLVVDINGIRFGFLAYTKDVNDNDLRIDSAKRAFCVKRLDGADFAADVQTLRDLGAEVVICMPHWGMEERRAVTSECERYAEAMVQAGVDIILGSHPHVVLPINLRRVHVNGVEKDVLIAWSMGNFISFMDDRYMDSGIIVDFTVSRDVDGRISIHDPGYVPVYVWGNEYRFHLVCSAEIYDDQPDRMSDDDFSRMRQSVREIGRMIDEEGIAVLEN